MKNCPVLPFATGAWAFVKPWACFVFRSACVAEPLVCFSGILSRVLGDSFWTFCVFDCLLETPSSV